jgi:predicted O-methyltransferase YrrM
MLAGILQDRPALSGILVDQPAVATEAEAAFASAGLGDRVSCVGGDFFDAVPAGGDVYTIANVLHDWDDGDATAILKAVRAAIPKHGRVLVLEHVLDAPGRSAPEQRDVHLVDLHMLVMFGARERSKQEYDALLTEAGFTESRLSGTRDWNVLESRRRG